MTRTGIDTHRRFLILQRDSFTCQFCGSRPGNDRLQVDHLIPSSQRGSDHDNNLTTACDRCNNGKSGRIAVPASLCTGATDAEGWRIWKRWGHWLLSWMPAEAALTFEPLDYWISVSRVHENDWHEHLEEKPWMYDGDGWDANGDRAPREIDLADPALISATDLLSRPPRPQRLVRNRNWRDFCDAIGFARTLIEPRRSR